LYNIVLLPCIFLNALINQIKIRMKKVALFLMTVFYIGAYAQQIPCSNCTYSITGLDKNNYTLVAGQTLCVTATGILQGTINLDGGTICNEGVFSPSEFTYSQGSFNNSSVIIYTGTFNLNASVNIDNNSSGVMNITGGINITNSNVQFSNNGTLNTTAIIVSAGTIINNGIMNYNNLSNNGGTYTNNGTANCCE